jgi:hypothetical protein
MQIVATSWLRIRDAILPISQFVYDCLDVVRNEDMMALELLPIYNPEVVIYAIYFNKFGIVKWLFDHRRVCLPLKPEMRHYLGKLDSLMMCGSEYVYIKGLFELVVMCGNINIIQLLYQSDLVSSRIKWAKVRIYDIRSNSHDEYFAVIKWLSTKCTIRYMKPAFYRAVNYGYLDVVEWLAEYYDIENDAVFGVETFRGIVYSAALDGHLDIIKWALGRCNIELTSSFLENAALGGRIHILEWLTSMRIEIPYRYFILARTAGKGHFAAMKWLYEHKQHCYKPDIHDITIYGNITDNAVLSGNMELVKWVIAHPYFPFWEETKNDYDNVRAISNAIQIGNLDMLKLFHPKGKCRCNPSADWIATAAEKGYLDIVKWLYKWCRVECTSLAMSNAASRGHMHVVKWLHYHEFKWSNYRMRGSAASQHTMDIAASWGDLSIIKWLSKHRKEGCTVWAIDYAARNNHYAVIEWLIDNRMQDLKSFSWRGPLFHSAFRTACEEGFLETIKVLYPHVAASTDALDLFSEAVTTASRCGYLVVVEYLLGRCEALRSKDFISKVVNTAKINGHNLIAEIVSNRF